MQRRPWPILVGGVGFLVLLTIPLFGIRLGFGDTGNLPERQTARRAYDLLAEGFGPGIGGPLIITVEGDTANDPAALDAFAAEIGATEGVQFSAPPTQLADGLAMITAYPASSPQDEATTDLVHRLRDDVIPASGVDAKLGGFTAAWRRLRQLHRRPAPVADRRGVGAVVPAADGGVPQPARPAQGGRDQPAVGRCRLRRRSSPSSNGVGART